MSWYTHPAREQQASDPRRTGYLNTFLASALMFALGMPTTWAQCPSIDFENLPVGTVVTNQYPGVTFSVQELPPSCGVSFARIEVPEQGTSSPTKALCVDRGSIGSPSCEFHPQWLRMILDPPVHYVSFTVGPGNSNSFQNYDIRAYSTLSGGSGLLDTEIVSGAGNGVFHPVTLVSAGNIRRVEIKGVFGAKFLGFECIDDLQIGLDTTPPIVEIDSPRAIDCACDMVDIVGSVSDPDGSYVGDRLEYRRSDMVDWTVADRARGPFKGVLYTWDTSLLAQGFYFVRVVGENACGLSDSDSTFVYVSTSFGTLELDWPLDPSVVGRTVCIEGTAWTQSCFDRYTVMYRLASGGPWLPVDQPFYSSTVITDELASWDSTLVADDDYLLRIQGFDDCENSDTVIHRVTIDNTAPVSVITSPMNCDYVNGIVPIIGTADDANLASWTLQYTGGSTHGWVTIASGTTPVIDGLLGNWTPSSRPPVCAYTLRLRVVDQSILNCRNSGSRNRTDYLVSLNVGDVCDINGDGVVDVWDIEPFLICLFP